MAYEKNRPDEALRMLSLANRTFPDDPFIKLRMVQLAQELGDLKTAVHLLKQLQELSWSEIYYPDMPSLLENMLAKNEERTEDSAEE
jgi:predicted Zn-dependent protease